MHVLCTQCAVSIHRSTNRNHVDTVTPGHQRKQQETHAHHNNLYCQRCVCLDKPKDPFGLSKQTHGPTICTNPCGKYWAYVLLTRRYDVQRKPAQKKGRRTNDQSLGRMLSLFFPTSHMTWMTLFNKHRILYVARCLQTPTIWQCFGATTAVYGSNVRIARASVVILVRRDVVLVPRRPPGHRKRDFGRHKPENHRFPSV